MAQTPIQDDEELKPLDPEVEKVRRKMVRFFMINIAILGIALLAVIIALFFKSSQSSDTNPLTSVNSGVPTSGDITSSKISLQAGETVLSQNLQGNTLSLLTRDENNRQSIVLFDIESQNIIARFAITPKN